MEIKYTQSFFDSMEKLFSNHPKFLIPRLFRDTRFRIRMFFQKLIRDYTDEEMWNFHYWLTSTIRPHFKHFVKYIKEHGCGCPGQLCVDENGDNANVEEGVKKWHAILDKIEIAFDLMWEQDNGTDIWRKKTHEQMVEDDKKIQEGLSLFAKYYQNFWD